MQKFISKFSLTYRNHIIKKDVSIKAGGKGIEKAPSKNTKAYELLENRRQTKPAHQNPLIEERNLSREPKHISF